MYVPLKPVKMTEDDYKVYKNILDKDKGMIKQGYNRIKERLKSIRETGVLKGRAVTTYNSI